MIDLGFEIGLYRLLECVEEVYRWAGREPVWTDSLHTIMVLDARKSAIKYGVFGIWRMRVHLALNKQVAQYGRFGAFGLSISLGDYAIARSLMEALPLMSVPAPALWKPTELKTMGLDIYLAIARTCHQHPAEVFQWDPEREQFWIDGRKLAKFFCWREFFPDADIPVSV